MTYRVGFRLLPATAGGCSVSAELDDGSLAADLLEAFPGAEPAGGAGSNRRVRVAGARPPYAVELPGAHVAAGLSRERAVGALDGWFDALLRSSMPPDTCAVHSFGALTEEGAMAVVGVSGAGKTTLGLALAKLGCAIMGDEYGYLNLATCDYYHALYPVPVKGGTFEALGMQPIGGVPMLSACGVRSALVGAGKAAAELGSEYVRGRAARLRWVLLPERDERFREAVMERMRMQDWPECLMPSLAGEGSRFDMFKGFVALAARVGLEVWRVRYADALDAARAIIREVGAHGR